MVRQMSDQQSRRGAEIVAALHGTVVGQFFKELISVRVVEHRSHVGGGNVCPDGVGVGSLLWSILGIGAVGVLEQSVEVDAIDQVDNTGVEGSKGIISHEGMKDRLDGLTPVDALLMRGVEGSSSFLLVGVADSIEIDHELFIPERL
jgi:hypothetical protein